MTDESPIESESLPPIYMKGISIAEPVAITAPTRNVDAPSFPKYIGRN